MDMEDGWHVVHYGKRRRNNGAPPRDWDYGRTGGQKARAPTFSNRRWFQSVPPYQPAPPPAPTRFPGPRTPYAEAARQSPQTPFGRRVSNTYPHVQRQAAGVQLGLLIRKTYKVIRLAHHLQNMSPHEDKPWPAMINRMVNTLTGMIKPALPSQRTKDLITGNALNWGHTTSLILMEHYEASLEDSLRDLVGGPTANWKEAFQVASRWARRNLDRITQAGLDHAEALITARLRGEQQPQALAPQPRAMPVQTPPTQTETQAPPQPKPRVSKATQPPQQKPAQAPTLAHIQTRPAQQKPPATTQKPPLTPTLVPWPQSKKTPPATTLSLATTTVLVATKTSQIGNWTSTPLDGDSPQEQRVISLSRSLPIFSTSVGDICPPANRDGPSRGRSIFEAREQGTIIDMKDIVSFLGPQGTISTPKPNPKLDDRVPFFQSGTPTRTPKPNPEP